MRSEAMLTTNSKVKELTSILSSKMLVKAILHSTEVGLLRNMLQIKEGCLKSKERRTQMPKAVQVAECSFRSFGISCSGQECEPPSEKEPASFAAARRPC